MSFTQDELQAFHTVLEQRLAVQRRELERSLEQHFTRLRREFEQRLLVAQQQIMLTLTQRLAEQQIKQNNAFNQKMDTLQTQLMRNIESEVVNRERQQLQRFEAAIQNGLAAQLLAMEQLLRQNLPTFVPTIENEQAIYDEETSPKFEAIEVQTEIPWEDLAEVVGKVLDERLTTLNESTQAAIKNMEQYLAVHLLTLRNELTSQKSPQQDGTLNNLQEVFASIEQLERLIESMQMAMTSNHTLLSNRIFHHQQLPLERAHLTTPETSTRERAPQQRGPLARMVEHETAEDVQ